MGVTNAVTFDADDVRELTALGPCAWGAATASAVTSNISDHRGRGAPGGGESRGRTGDRGQAAIDPHRKDVKIGQSHSAHACYHPAAGGYRRGTPGGLLAIGPRPPGQGMEPWQRSTCSR